jgi:site-specific DNA recombinase
LLIAEDTRWIIKKIYALAVRGVGAAKTSKVLTQEKGSTPGWLNYQRKGTFANIYANAPEGKAYAWTIAQVKSILEDETYIENSVHYRETNISARTPASGYVSRGLMRRSFRKMFLTVCRNRSPHAAVL